MTLDDEKKPKERKKKKIICSSRRQSKTNETQYNHTDNETRNVGMECIYIFFKNLKYTCVKEWNYNPFL